MESAVGYFLTIYRPTAGLTVEQRAACLLARTGRTMFIVITLLFLIIGAFLLWVSRHIAAVGLLLPRARCILSSTFSF